MASELFFLYAELGAENTNPQHRQTPLQFQKYIFFKLHLRQKISTSLLRFTGSTDFGRSQFVASKVILEF